MKNGIKQKIVSEDAVKESLVSLKRAGSSAIVTYFALEIAEKLKNLLFYIFLINYVKLDNFKLF